MVLLHRVAGMGLGEADELRSEIVASGGDGTILNRLYQGFLERAVKHGTTSRSASEAWAIAQRLAAYSFNKAHSASYGRLAYCSAYMKAHHPLDFACALLNHHEGLYPLRVEAAELARRGIELRPPHVNHSGCCTMRERNGGSCIRIGLNKVKGLAERSIQKLLETRKLHGPYTSMWELLGKVPLRQSEITGLVMAGACDGLPPLYGISYPFVHEAFLEKLKQGQLPAEEGIFTVTPPPGADPEKLFLYQELTRVRNELTHLGMHLSAHPMKLLRREALRYGCKTIKDAVAATPESTVRVAVTVAAMKRVPTQNGIMQFITFDDETGLVEAVLMPPIYRQAWNRVTTPGPFLVAGTVRQRQMAVHLEVFRIDPFFERSRPFGR